MGVRPPGFVARAGGFGRKLGEFIEPSAIALDPGRWRAYVSDRGNRRIQLLELQSSETSATGFAPEAKVIGSIEPAGAVPRPSKAIDGTSRPSRRWRSIRPEISWPSTLRTRRC
jgi:hypothetical protein